MIKQLITLAVSLLVGIGIAFAQVDVNKADQAALDGVKGIGPAMSKTILDERKKGGSFKDWADFQERIKGIGDKSADKLSKAGLLVNGQTKASTTVAQPVKKAPAEEAEPAMKSEPKGADKDMTKADPKKM